MKLTLAMKRQLLAYIEDRERTGWYYNPKEQFEKRHRDLLIWIKEQIPKKQEGS